MIMLNNQKISNKELLKGMILEVNLIEEVNNKLSLVEEEELIDKVNKVIIIEKALDYLL